MGTIRIGALQSPEVIVSFRETIYYIHVCKHITKSLYNKLRGFGWRTAIASDPIGILHKRYCATAINHTMGIPSKLMEALARLFYISVLYRNDILRHRRFPGVGHIPASGTPPQLRTTPLQQSAYLSNHVPSCSNLSQSEARELVYNSVYLHSIKVCWFPDDTPIP
jgi:hypothetical protein